ncbi:NACHT, LRR and PYD domains-containing protein 12 [Silurus asotus]|uniref:NACHT, LRR and PYD domains-containing protein 12 n=1 Tax=Silurus asotus TaxID=30991 RepID=A0AAD5A7R6_SILAS|nr:NACHT, LRR and PYD domains-containing protein 12 [Silurus asotus]
MYTGDTEVYTHTHTHTHTLDTPHCTLEILRLCQCDLAEESCRALSSVLSLNSSRLRELYLTGNNLQDSGVKLLSVGLKTPHCTLELLEMRDCKISDAGFIAVASALKSNPSSQLRELNLNGNKTGKSGMKMLSALLNDPLHKLETLQ